jgi:hypothetical protein
MWNTFVVAWKFCYHVEKDEWMSLKDWWNDTDRAKPKCLKRYHFIYHKSHVNWPQIEPMPLWWQNGNLHPQPWHSPKFGTRKVDRLSFETQKKINVRHPLATVLTCFVCAHILLIVTIMTLSKKLKILQRNTLFNGWCLFDWFAVNEN